MSNPTDLIALCQQWLMDENEQAYQASQIGTQLAVEASRLANGRVIGQVTIAQAVQGRAYYPLDEMGTLLTTDIATGGSGTTLVDSGASFVASGVTTGVSRVRDLSDGCSAIVDSVATTTLTCNNGFAGGVTNIPASGDVYVIETPIDASRVVEVSQVYYNGKRLLKTTEHELDVRQPGWESWQGEPRYWLADSADVVSTIRIVPAPQRSGSSVPVIPLAPFIMDWRDNLMVFLYEDALDAGVSTTGLPDTFDDLLVYATVASMAAYQTEYENVPLARLTPQLAALWQQGLVGGEE